MIALLCAAALVASPALPEKVQLHFVDASLREVVAWYEVTSGRRVVFDPHLEGQIITVDSALEMSSPDALRFVERAFLLGGFVLLEDAGGFLLTSAESRGAIEGVMRKELEVPVEDVERTLVLRYVDVTEFVGVIRDALSEKPVEVAPVVRPLAVHDERGSIESGFIQGPVLQGQNARAALSQNQAVALGQSSFGMLGKTEAASLRSQFVAGLSVVYDVVSRVVHLRGPKEKVELVAALAERVDVRPSQIVLSAVIGEYVLGDDMALGLDVVSAVQKTAKGAWAASSFQSDGFKSGVKDLGTLTLSDLAGVTRGVSVYATVTEFGSAYLHAMENTNRFHVLQRPSVSTVNNKPARIYTGQQLAIAAQTLTSAGVSGSGASVASTTQYVPVRLELEITPKIIGNRELKLEFHETNNDVSGYSVIAGNSVPNISEQGMQNTLIVPDGATVMLGGLITQRERASKTGVPFLVRVPVLKHLFGSTNRTQEKRELMIFVTASILDTPADLQREAVADRPMTVIEQDITSRFGR